MTTKIKDESFKRFYLKSKISQINITSSQVDFSTEGKNYKEILDFLNKGTDLRGDFLLENYSKFKEIYQNCFDEKDLDKSNIFQNNFLTKGQIISSDQPVLQWNISFVRLNYSWLIKQYKV